MVKKRPGTTSKRVTTTILKPKTPNQAMFMEMITSHDLTICDAIAGCGKTTVSVGMACSYLLDGKVNEIILTRPLAQCGPGAGFLPGNILEKTMPFMRPLLDALDMFLPDGKQKYFENKSITITPLETLRGGNLHNCFIILDEMQNCTYKQLKMIGTRIGHGSKAVFIGDCSQSDVDTSWFNNTDYIKKNFFDNLRDESTIGFAHLTAEDIVRSGIAKIIATKCP